MGFHQTVKVITQAGAEVPIVSQHNGDNEWEIIVVINDIPQDHSENTRLKDCIFLFRGDFRFLSIGKLKYYMGRTTPKIQDKLDENTTHLVKGYNIDNDPILQECKDIGIHIISEIQFMEMLRDDKET